MGFSVLSNPAIIPLAPDRGCLRSFPVDVPYLPIYTQGDSLKGEEYRVTRRLADLLRSFPFITRLPYLVYSRMQARYTLGVAAVILNSDGHVLLVEHAYHPRIPWGLPGGWLDSDEEPTAAIERELREELQLKARVLRVVHTARTVPNHIDLAFHCEALSPIGKLSHELLAYRWARPEKLPEIKSFTASP